MYTKGEIDLQIIQIIESDEEIKNILKDCPYNILNKWEFREYIKGEIICHQGMKYDYFYIIVEGYANISLTAENGKTFSQAIYKKGDYFGELEIFENQPYICSIEALTDIRIIRIKKDYFIDWLNKDDHFSLYLTKTLCKNFYNLSKLSGKNTLYSLKYRICNYLLFKLESQTSRERVIEIEIDKEQLSTQFAVTSRSINRVLKELKEKNIIDVSNRKIYILDLDALKEEETRSRNQ